MSMTNDEVEAALSRQIEREGMVTDSLTKLVKHLDSTQKTNQEVMTLTAEALVALDLRVRELEGRHASSH